jgi:hypothetical protein
MEGKGVELRKPEEVKKSKKKREIQFYVRPFQYSEEIVCTRPDAKITLGDSILLESVKYPGVFVSKEYEHTSDEVARDNCIPLSKTTSEASALMLRPHLAPLNILVKLRVGSRPTSSDYTAYNGRSKNAEDKEVEQNSGDYSFEADVEDRLAVELMR